MDKQEARGILTKKLDEYRARSYADLVAMVGELETCEAVGASGADYQIEINVYWDHRPGGDICVSGGIDDGGWRAAFSPLCEDFIMSPDGESCCGRGRGNQRGDRAK